MKFFVPAAKDSWEAEAIYQAARKVMESQMGPLLSTRYYAIYYRHNGAELRTRVGDPDPLIGEKVIAIFRTKRNDGPFLICTVKRGVVQGALIQATRDARAIHFELA
jgi:hypothetical protein